MLTPRMALAPSLALLGVPSSSIISWSIASWSRGSRPISSGAILVLTLSTALSDAFADVAFLVVVAQLDGFVLAGAGAAGDGRPAEGAVFEEDVHLDGGIAAGVEDLPALNEFDAQAHGYFQERDCETTSRRRLSRVPPFGYRTKLGKNSNRPEVYARAVHCQTDAPACALDAMLMQGYTGRT